MPSIFVRFVVWTGFCFCISGCHQSILSSSLLLDTFSAEFLFHFLSHRTCLILSPSVRTYLSSTILSLSVLLLSIVSLSSFVVVHLHRTCLFLDFLLATMPMACFILQLTFFTVQVALFLFLIAHGYIVSPVSSLSATNMYVCLSGMIQHKDCHLNLLLKHPWQTWEIPSLIFKEV
ncbi:hypothetical protein NEOLEDRAFT_368219 [Neolentinus lepideus HHB14362 ss-1]|uniref:Uncharacterized protein n=1 Tax=Neolentinus lepideus HHB14362 ss-1 TaxID=1314782 RepID=A0A165SH28_9AGAM|nr:hypothetical protein NEOLEDRAFT_368219 [Neolentinus lepideus HHB14362 ss-1]